MNENKYVTQQQTVTTELKAPDLGRNIDTDCGGIKHVSGISTLTLHGTVV